MKKPPPEPEVQDPPPYSLPRQLHGVPVGASLATLLIRLRDSRHLGIPAPYCVLCERRPGRSYELSPPTELWLQKYVPPPGPDGRVVVRICRPCSRVPRLRLITRPTEPPGVSGATGRGLRTWRPGCR